MSRMSELDMDRQVLETMTCTESSTVTTGDQRVRDAAPEMLAALIAIQEWLMFPKELTKDQASGWNEAFVKANNAAVAAIAKAKGAA